MGCFPVQHGSEHGCRRKPLVGLILGMGGLLLSDSLFVTVGLKGWAYADTNLESIVSLSFFH